jgi:hypothetical protein
MGMFGSSKSTASLSSGLLARKGQARPAMRPQGYHGTSLNLEDLGWDDMGDEAAPSPPPPTPRPVLAAVETPPAEPVPAPPVLAQREVLREEVEAPVPAPVPDVPPVKPVSVATAGRIAREVGATKAKSAAFTLRLNADRHLRLRLAAACRHRSAQALVTEALDAFLSSCTEIEPLIGQLGRTSKTSGEKS